MKLDRTKYFIRGNEKYPELIRQFFKGYQGSDLFKYNDCICVYHIYTYNIVSKCSLNFYAIKDKTELKLTDLAIKNDLGEFYVHKMKEFFEKLGAIIEFENRDFDTDYYYKVYKETNKVGLVDFYTFKGVSILLSDWLGVEVPKEKTESLTAFEAEVLEKTKRRTFKIESFKNKITKEQQHIFIHYQLCPKCNGQGIVSISPLVAGDVSLSTGSSSQYTCNVCNGQKIIPMYFKQ